MQAPASHLIDSERAELESVLEALVRNPRLAKLLSFVAEECFAGRADEVSEYHIATEVFGRSKTTFDASQDSIARVEAYRLRKKLKEYYETDGREHEIQISLPSGTYVPKFTHRVSSAQAASLPESRAAGDEVANLASSTAAGSEQALVLPEKDMVETEPASPRERRKRVLYSIVGIAALLVIIFGAARFFSRSQSGHQQDAIMSHQLDAAHPSPQNVAQVPLRLLAGYDGPPKIDSTGAHWQSDRYFHGGASFQRPDVRVARTSDPMLFEHWRTGDFTYDIPLAPGPYELHLYFVALPTEDIKATFFNVILNGQPLLKAFSINSDVLGANIADERVFKDIYPDKDGFLHLAFSMERSAPYLNAIAILPGLSHRQLPIRIVMQQAALTDHDGNLWHPDSYFENGAISDPPRQVTGSPDPNLYARERYGHFTYSIPVDTRGRYTLVLHFAELYWVPQDADSGVTGRRIFKVYCNGTTLLDNFDVFKEAGSLTALTKTFYHLRPSPEGKLDLTFEPIANYATISAIEVLDESQ